MQLKKVKMRKITQFLISETRQSAEHLLGKDKLQSKMFAKLNSRFLIWDNYFRAKLFRVNATTIEQVDLLLKLVEEQQMDFWKVPTLQEPGEVMVNQEEEINLREFLNTFNISYSVVINDIER